MMFKKKHFVEEYQLIDIFGELRIQISRLNLIAKMVM
jgi:hypothetical protein